MEKENIVPSLDEEAIIEYLGVSKRLGNNVLQELEQRAMNILPEVSALQCKVDKECQDTRTISTRFQNEHELGFRKMESIDTHYSLNRLQIPETPRKRSKDKDEGIKSSKKKRQSLHVGQQKNELAFSPVSDITHRIRRLRVRLQAPNDRERRRNMVGSTPLTESRPMYDENVPTFAKPTATSMQRKQMNTPFFKLSNGNKTTGNNVSSNEKTKQRPGSIFRDLANAKSNSNNINDNSIQDDNTCIIENKNNVESGNKSTIRKEIQDRNRISSSKSVFERLYEHASMSRSNSCNNMKIMRSKTSHNLTTETKTRLSKSQTQNNLTIDTLRSKSTEKRMTMTKSTTLQNLSGNNNRPQWR